MCGKNKEPKRSEVGRCCTGRTQFEDGGKDCGRIDAGVVQTWVCSSSSRRRRRRRGRLVIPASRGKVVSRNHVAHLCAGLVGRSRLAAARQLGREGGARGLAPPSVRRRPMAERLPASSRMGLLGISRACCDFVLLRPRRHVTCGELREHIADADQAGAELLALGEEPQARGKRRLCLMKSAP